jgi:cell division protein FtsI/penicillin-binding protein 2
MNPFSELRDQFVIDILGITDKFYANAITALFFLAFILFMAYIVKIIIQDIKENRKGKKERAEREKKLIQSFKEKNKK